MTGADLLEAVRAEGVIAGAGARCGPGPGPAEPAAGGPEPAADRTEPPRVVVMLSGGRDSVCLFDVCTRLLGAERVRTLHVNYSIRDDADLDQRFCEELCASASVDLRVHRPSGPPPAGENLQAWARDERYEAASRLADEMAGGEPCGGEVLIAAGHTASDQVETILYRLAAAPSRRALLGMRHREGRLIRPLLSYTREQTAAHCRARGFSWREDPTNETDRFTRGRIRTRLVPALREIHPAAEANVLALARILREEAEVLDELVDGALAGRDAIELRELRALPLPLARLTLQRLADSAAGGPAPGTARRARDLLALSDHAELDLPHGVRARVTRGTLRMERRLAR